MSTSGRSSRSSPSWTGMRYPGNKSSPVAMSLRSTRSPYTVHLTLPSLPLQKKRKQGESAPTIPTEGTSNELCPRVLGTRATPSPDIQKRVFCLPVVSLFQRFLCRRQAIIHPVNSRAHQLRPQSDLCYYPNSVCHSCGSPAPLACRGQRPTDALVTSQASPSASWQLPIFFVAQVKEGT